jgi:hypothetical protein
MATPIIETIAAAIKTALDELVTSGDASSCARPVRVGSPASPADKSILLYQEDPALDEEGPMGFLQWMQPFLVFCFVKPSDTATAAVDTAINALRSAVEKKIRETPTWGGYAIDTRIQPPTSFAEQSGAYAGAIVTFIVLYRTLEDDPYSQS